jgi:hypothetical protein
MENPMSTKTTNEIVILSETDTATDELLIVHQQLQAVYYKRANALKQERMIARHIERFNIEIGAMEKRRSELAEIVSQDAVRLYGASDEAVAS